MSKYQKQTVMTGLGDGYFQKMTKEDTKTQAPEYDSEGALIVPSLQQAQTEMSFDAKPLWLSNKRHSDLGRLSDVAITLNAAYLPEGFAEWATGAIKIGPGAYAYNSKPIRKFFRFAFPATDNEGGVVVYNFPKCQLEPVGLNPQTETEEQDAQISDFNIVGNALVYAPTDAVDGDNDNIYLKVDTRVEEAKNVYSITKLLELGWYDKASLEKCKGSPSPVV